MTSLGNTAPIRVSEPIVGRAVLSSLISLVANGPSYRAEGATKEMGWLPFVTANTV